jgi:hypothetical protein
MLHKLISIALFIVVIPSCLALLASPLWAQTVSVKHGEGLLHGFLILRTLDGTAIADGEVAQTAQGDRVTTRTTFHFKDGSMHEETAVLSQKGNFRLLKDTVVQRGPAFERAMETSFDAATGQFNVRYTDDDGKETSINERLKPSVDFANGMVPVLLKNLAPGTPRLTASVVTAMPRPRIVKLVITPEGQESFRTGNATHTATRYVVKVEIGGIAGVIAPLLGKQPADTHVWIMLGDAPTFLRSEGPMYEGGPIWRIELVSPSWDEQRADKP